MKRPTNLFFVTGLIALLSLFCQTCKEDKLGCSECNSKGEVDVCDSFPTATGGISIVKPKPNQRFAPCFNPNDGSEFIYVKEENFKQKLVKYNLNTEVETILLDATQIVGQPKWGKNGWITFSGANYQINLIKENGDMLHQITSSNFHLYPDWRNDSIIAFEFSFNLGVPYFYGELSLDGSIKDTIRNRSFTLGSMNYYGEGAFLIFRDNPNVNYFNNSKSVALTSFKFSGRNRIEGISWHPNSTDVYYSTYREGLYKVNINSKKVVKIRNGCDSRSYRYLSISPDGKKIIVERVDATDYQNTSGSWTEEAKIYIMDIDGKNEKNVFE